jgi:hypothetical protein
MLWNVLGEKVPLPAFPARVPVWRRFGAVGSIDAVREDNARSALDVTSPRVSGEAVVMTRRRHRHAVPVHVDAGSIRVGCDPAPGCSLRQVMGLTRGFACACSNL